MGDLEIFLLGRFEVLVDGVQVADQRWSRKKAKVLVKLLALAPQHKVHREQLIEVLWPDTDAELALNNFHKVIHAARRALEPDLTQGVASRFLLTQDLQVSLAAGDIVRIDADEFEQRAGTALKTGDTSSLQAALALYRGPLLEEDLYEDWASVRRERVSLLYQRVLERLAGNYETAGDEHAIEILNRLIAANRANEDAHRRLMRIYAVTGQRHLALNQYRLCCDALKEELDTGPDAATVRLYEALLAGRGPEAATPVSATQAPFAAAASPVPPKKGSKTLLWIACTTALAALALPIWKLIPRWDTSHAPPASLAILPLRVGEPAAELDPVADGITEGLINSVSRLPGIRVMARGTVFAYKGRSDARNVGRELKVTTVLFGRVAKQTGTFTVGIELIDVGDGARLWARQYSVPADGIPQVLQLVASELATALQLKLTDPQRDRDKRNATVDPEAYRLYLTGRSYWNQRTTEGFRKSIDYYQRAIDRDPGYALAYAGLADSYGLLGWHAAPPRDCFPRARAAAEKALQLDEGQAEAQTSLAMVSALYDWNWPAAEAQFRRAIEINRGYATAHHWYGVHLGAMRRFEEAARELAIALDLDPLSLPVNVNCGYPLYYQRRYREALGVYDKALVLNPGFAPVHEDRESIFELEGKPEEAAREAVQFLRLSGQTELAGSVQQAYDKSGYRAAMQAWREAAEKPPSKGYSSPMIPALLAMRLGDREKSFSWLERAYQDRCPQLVYLAADPIYEALRSDPRFEQLIKRIGLPL